MNRFRQSFLCAASCLVLLPANVSQAANYALDMSHTSIIFGISHMNYSYTYGRFNKAQGNFVWNNANPSTSKFVVAIETASIDTNDAKRDAHLRNAALRATGSSLPLWHPAAECRQNRSTETTWRNQHP